MTMITALICSGQEVRKNKEDLMMNSPIGPTSPLIGPKREEIPSPIGEHRMINWI